MASVNVLCTDGAQRSFSCESVICPGCGTRIVPKYLCYDLNYSVFFCMCPVETCGSFFMRRQYQLGREFIHNYPLKKEVYSETINNLSPNFVKIYNEAYAAEQMSLLEVCGVGYRKALEFLIKDYATEGKEAVEAEQIRTTLLGKCIETYVPDMNVKNVAKRAVWLGNDETHYTRKWEEKDVQDLKGLIRLTVRWIEQEKETAKLLMDMPEGR